MMASREASVFGCLREVVNVLVNWALSSLQECMDPGGKLLYQSIAVFLRVVGQPAFDRSSNVEVLEHSFETVDVVDRVVYSIIAGELGRFHHSPRNWGIHDAGGQGTA